jgi:hypothetical protein
MWGAGKLLLLGGALLLTYLLFAAAAMRVALRAREVVVRLAGKTVNDATIALSGGPQPESRRSPTAGSKVLAGQIYLRDPGPGARLPRRIVARREPQRCGFSGRTAIDGRFRDSIVRIPV